MHGQTLIRLGEAALQLAPGPHPVEVAHAPAIDEGWAQRLAANPRLYDGQTVLCTRLGLAGGKLEAEASVIRYATLLHFLHSPVRLDGVHLYCCAALVGSDGKAVMARMAAHTANPGRIYFPSGSLEPSDFDASGRCDFAANMAREVREETGIDLAAAQAEPGWLCWNGGRIVALFRIHRFSVPAAELAAMIDAHLGAGHDDELERAAIFSPGDTDEAMPAPTRAFMACFRG